MKLQPIVLTSLLTLTLGLTACDNNTPEVAEDTNQNTQPAPETTYDNAAEEAERLKKEAERLKKEAESTTSE